MEEWKTIPGFNGFYEASSTGKIRRLKRSYSSTFKGNPVTRVISQKELKPSPSTKKYPRLTLIKDGKCKQFFVHYLVCLAFIGERPQGFQVNHIDGNKSNNSIENLEYLSNQDNRTHAVINGLAANRDNGLGKLSSGDISKISDLYRMGFRQNEISRVFKVSQQTISKLLRNENSSP